MKYLVLRDCFTAEQRFYAKGDVVDLPDEMFKYEKNFRLLEKEPVKVEEGTTLKEIGERKPIRRGAPVETITPQPSTEAKPGEYFCTKCNGFHRKNSKVGKRHLKYK